MFPVFRLRSLAAARLELAAAAAAGTAERPTFPGAPYVLSLQRSPVRGTLQAERGGGRDMVGGQSRKPLQKFSPDAVFSFLHLLFPFASKSEAVTCGSSQGLG